MAIIGKTTNGPESRAAGGPLSADDFMLLVQSKDAAARIAAAAREDAPMGALIAFAQDPKVEVRAAVASNPGIGRTTTVGDALARDRSAEVARALVNNAAVGSGVLAIVAEEGHKSVREEARSRLGS